MRPLLRALCLAALGRLRGPCGEAVPVTVVVDAVEDDWMFVELGFLGGQPAPAGLGPLPLRAPRGLRPAEGDRLYGWIDADDRLRRARRLPAVPAPEPRPAASLPLWIDL